MVPDSWMSSLPFKHIRCNPDVAPRLTSGGHEDKDGGGEFWSLMEIYLMLLPQSTCVHRGWPILIPHEDKVDVFTPAIILLIGVSKFDPSWRYSWCFYPNQHIVHRGRRILIPHEDKVDVITPINILFRGGGEFWPLMKIKMIIMMMVMVMMMMIMIMIMIMTIVSVEQRPGWGKHI